MITFNRSDFVSLLAYMVRLHFMLFSCNSSLLDDESCSEIHASVKYNKSSIW